MDRDDTINQLNKLIETCRDGEYGFRACAANVKSPDLQTIFLRRADDCVRGAAELQALVARLGGKVEDDGSISGALHRGWVSVKAVLTGKSDVAILEECERGEDTAMDRYREAIKAPLPADVMDVVRRQYDGVKRNHDQIRTLRDQVKATS